MEHPAAAAARVAPGLPGVYFFYSSDHQLLYVGMSKNLTRRLAQHFPVSRKVQPRPTRQHRAAASTAMVTWIHCKTELDALLLEDRLIKRHLPIVNKRQKKFQLQQYAAVRRGDKPQVRTVGLAGIGDLSGWELYGPFPDQYYLDKVMDIARRYLGGTVEGLRKTLDVEALRRFLAGSDESILKRIEQSMNRHAAARMFELAHEDKRSLLFAGRFLERQRFVRSFARHTLAIDHIDGSSWRFARGALFEDEQAASPASETPWWLLDRAIIVYSWLHRNRDETQYRFL